MPQHLGLSKRRELCLAPRPPDPSFEASLWRTASSKVSLFTASKAQPQQVADDDHGSLNAGGTSDATARFEPSERRQALLRRRDARAAHRIQRAFRDGAYWRLGPYRAAIVSLRSLNDCLTPHEKRERFGHALNTVSNRRALPGRSVVSVSLL